MNIEIFGYIELILIPIGLFANIEIVGILMACLSMFVAAAGITIGTFSLNPAVLFLPVFVVRAFNIKAHLNSTKSSDSIYYLLAFLLWSLTVTVLIPRIFTDTISVIWTDEITNGQTLQLLHPNRGNWTQTLYALGAGICFLAFYIYFRRIKNQQFAVNLVVGLAICHLFWSFFDLLTSVLGTGSYLDFIRNGNYVILAQDEISGIKRICGTFPEASLYATYSLSILAILTSFYRSGIRTRTTGALALILFLFLVLSMSTTAIVGFIIYSLWIVSSVVVCSLRKNKIYSNSSPLLCVLILIFVLIGISFFFGNGNEVVDQLILNKINSDSGIERGFWNHIAWDAFVESYGIGIGLGSTRASSFLIVLLSNTGIIGTALFSIYLMKAFRLPKATSTESEIHSLVLAYREGIIGYMIGAILSSTVFDLGLLPYILSGTAAALSTHTVSILKPHAYYDPPRLTP